MKYQHKSDDFVLNIVSKCFNVENFKCQFIVHELHRTIFD